MDHAELLQEFSKILDVQLEAKLNLAKGSLNDIKKMIGEVQGSLDRIETLLSAMEKQTGIRGE